ncbi:MAG: amino acid adenylation domain-containing protein [Cyanobacteria bacterium P01_G01_bin.39]
MSNISARIAALSPSQRALLERRLQAKKVTKAEINTTINPRKDRDSGILSYAQERQWFLHQLEPDTASYNEINLFQLTGFLDVAVLERSFNQVIQRHEILRSKFIAVNEEPRFQIAPTLPFTLSAIKVAEESTAFKLATQAAQKTFDLSELPLFRVKLFEVSPQQYYLLIVVHHIICDGWSSGVFIQEVIASYTAFKENQSPSLPELSIQYADFALWERQRLEKNALAAQLDYWKKQLSGNLPILEIPTTKSQQVTADSANGGIASRLLPLDLTNKLHKIGQKENVTLFMTLLSAFKVLLHRYTSLEDILVGSPIANRSQPECENLIGVFLNTLVLRSNLSGNPTFRELLQQVKQVALDAYSNQDLPFEKLVQELQPERSLNQSPLFQVMFVLQNAPESEFRLPGLTVERLKLDSGVALFDLTLEIKESDRGLDVCFEYNRDRFNDVSIKRMLEHYQILLEKVVANPSLHLSQIDFLTRAEKNKLLFEWNDNQVQYPQDKCIHSLFESQVIKTPNAIAVVDQEQQLTYQELNGKANQLAHYLQQRGIKPEGLVGICLERSLEMTIAILGILKAGAAYIPIDVNYPQERIEYILEDAQVEILLTQEHLEVELAQHQTTLLYLERHWLDIAQKSSNNCLTQVSSGNLAYVIYTSGSTGKPKGVAVEHRALVNYSLEIAQQFQLQNSDRFLQFAAIGFDVVVEELFPTWIKGATVVLRRGQQSISGREFQQLIEEQQVTVFELPTAYWQQWVSELISNQEAVPSCVRLVIVGGERMSSQILRQWQNLSTKLIHVYGLTETTVTSTLYHLNSEIPREKTEAGLPIGRPIANTQIYLLDSEQQPVPVGVAGEIYIGGAGLARGYLNRPQLTAQRFVANPFNSQAGSRLYRTGDLGRYLADGNLEYIGRIDNQVKIRGFRIELGEIEVILGQHSTINHCAVVPREDTPGDKRLVAYFVAREQLEVKQLRDFLKLKLPDYMIPSAWMQLEALPLTPNGKVDRKALPIPDFTLNTTNYIAPHTPHQEILVNIWQSVLNIEQVGIEDNFFELGGHSLLTTQVVSKIRQVFEIELPLRSLFEKPTISGLAQELDEAIKNYSGINASTIEKVSRSEKLPLSYAQQRLWFLTQLEPDSPFYNIPAAVRLQGKLNLKALEQSFNEIVRRHEALRTNFHTTEEGEALAVISQVELTTIALLDLSELPTSQKSAQIQEQIELSAQQPFDLSHEQLIRIKLLRLEEEEHIVLLTMHHVVFDAWSVGVLVEELGSLYQAFSQGKPSPLNELPIQYVDFAAWQRQWLQGEVLETQKAYWLKQLENVPTVLELPTDYPRPATQTFRGASYSFELSRELHTALNQLSQQQGTTLFMTLLAGFQTLLWHYTGQEDIVVGSPIANRNRAEIEGLIGFFTNTLVFRTNLAGNPSFEELLKQVREVSLGAYAHQDLPFELLVEQLQPERHLSHSPVFQVMFAFENAPMSELEFSELTLTPVESESDTSKFDITLSITETELGLEGSFEYNIDLFESATISRMLGHLKTLLEAIVANPQQKLSDLPLLTESEQRQLLVQWNNTEVDYPQDQCIHQLFETQVAKTPDAVAIVFENQQLTYQELNLKANQLAHYIRQKITRTTNSSAQILIGICVERSLEMVIGLLAILKAGAAYIPLDPNYPEQRLAFILEDTNVSLLLSEQKLLPLLTKYQTQVICLDGDWDKINQEDSHNPIDLVNPQKLAYIIYTSGSTGKPKGVQITHTAVVNFLTSMSRTPGLTATDILLAVTTISFDIAALEIYLPLTLGARLVLVSREVATDGHQLSQHLALSQASVMQATPATWRLLLDSQWQGNQNLKILCGGEALDRSLANQLLSRSSEVWNLYGPTETTIWSAVYQVEEEVKSTKNIIPIGRAIANTQFYILNQQQQLVPAGVRGELYIGGVGLARGYFNRPDLTQEKFILHPFKNIEMPENRDNRLYKTGDLARYLPNGELEYLGRIDNQVKIRGFRIELGEIEAILAKYSAINHCVVIARKDAPGDKQLVAYFVAREQLEVQQLRDFLKSKLPDYMIPSAWMQLEALPLTPNGKCDQRALPEIQDAPREFIPPETVTEKNIVAIWQEVLKRSQISVEDDFFDLGGHSLLAAQVISRLREQYQQEIPLRSLFEETTVAKLATYLDRMQTLQQLQTIPTDIVSEREEFEL